MNCFDVLVLQETTWCRGVSYYGVYTVRAADDIRARACVDRKLAGWVYADGYELLSHKIVASGACGVFDQFQGKPEGYFIDAALGSKAWDS